MTGSSDDALRDLTRRAHEEDPTPVEFDPEAGLADLFARATRAVITEIGRTLAATRLEHARLVAAGEDTARIEEMLPHVEQLAATTHNIEIFERIRAAVARYSASLTPDTSTGPYPAEEFAALAGATEVGSVHLVLADLINEGLARPVPTPPRTQGAP